VQWGDIGKRKMNAEILIGLDGADRSVKLETNFNM
jgi:hypothetical protein